ncbi:MAG: BREX system P-loop protein BrxC [Deltaproteobacteria bacterium]|jgi:hypothetical protein|nr:BREX system P-loop protein BrxC [Deltaproteobacteria bacterium]
MTINTNRDVYLKAPSERKLVNEGVASVNDSQDERSLAVLRYELETFVCKGQYEKGMAHILDTYHSNIERAQQPGVWVSGFFGSGKSHLVKMLRALWTDVEFQNGEKASVIANLSDEVRLGLKRLKTLASRHHGLHAASGTLGSGASDSVRLALLGIVFRSAGLPEMYHLARFVMYLKESGNYAKVRKMIEEKGIDWEDELSHFLVAGELHQALATVIPNVFGKTQLCSEILLKQFPFKKDVSNQELANGIRQALVKNHALSRKDELPLTLIILDEVQQYIGESGERSSLVQEAVETCCKAIGPKLLFIATGQSAIAATDRLKKLEGRFTVRIELSDSDVDTVVREVILLKKPEAIKVIEAVRDRNQGEISRHLLGTALSHRQEDNFTFAEDYPILPTRRRFWERSLRVLDRSGTDSQLRNQLSMVYKAIQTNLDKPVGNVIAADYLYFDLADKLIQARMLPRKLHEKTMTWIKSENEEDILKARICGTVFLINKLSSAKSDTGIKADKETITDLLLVDLETERNSLLQKIPEIAEKCELLMKVGDEYRIQTEESLALNDEFESQRSLLSGNDQSVEAIRSEKIKNIFKSLIGNLSIVQGESKVTRNIHVYFESNLPKEAKDKLSVWVRSGWETDEKSVSDDAMEAGNDSPLIFVFVPRRSSDYLRHKIIENLAATKTLEKLGVPATPEGREAKESMETRKNESEKAVNNIISEAFSEAKVFQGGGSELNDGSLRDMLLKAGDAAINRLYPQFKFSNSIGWEKVYRNAKDGAPDALKAVGYEGPPENNRVCRTMLDFLAGSKMGNEIRATFESPPYGWSGDCVDGAIQVLLVSGLINANDQNNRRVQPVELERKNIGKTRFKPETVNLTAIDRLNVRSLLQQVGVPPKKDEELSQIPLFLEKALFLANDAGGEKPKPVPPDVSILETMKSLGGNEQLLYLSNVKDELSTKIQDWKTSAEKIQKRWPGWIILKELSNEAAGLPGSVEDIKHVRAIEENRLLLSDTDTVPTLQTNFSSLLRNELNSLNQEYLSVYTKGQSQLEEDKSWMKLDEEIRKELLVKYSLSDSAKPQITVNSIEDILKTLKILPIKAFRDQLAALPTRFKAIMDEAAFILEPKIQSVTLPSSGTFNNKNDVDIWVEEVRTTLINALNNGGPVRIQ